MRRDKGDPSLRIAIVRSHRTVPSARFVIVRRDNGAQNPRRDVVRGHSGVPGAPLAAVRRDKLDPKPPNAVVHRDNAGQSFRIIIVRVFAGQRCPNVKYGPHRRVKG